VRYVVLTDPTGANRVYESGGVTFDKLARASATASDGAEWEVTEDALIGPGGQRLDRLPAHRAFWFGWQAAHPETRLLDD